MKTQIIDHTWNLEPLFSSEDDPQIEIQRKKVEEETHKFINEWQNRTDYLENPAILLEALDEYENWSHHFGVYERELYYLSLRTSLNQLDTDLKARFQLAIDRATKLHNQIQFFMLRIAKIQTEVQEKILSFAPLAKYHHLLKKLFDESKYHLSEAEEKILSLKSQTSHSNWVDMVEAFISKEERKVLLEDGTFAQKTFEGIMPLIQSKDKKVRVSAARAINQILEKHVEVAEHEINSILTDKKVNDDLRGLSRPDLSRHLSDDIDSSVVDSLIATVSEHFDLSKRWYSLRAKLLGLKKIEYYERLVEFGELPTNFTFEESYKLVSKVFHNLDPEFGQILDSYYQKGQLDVYPRVGKSGGGFCASSGITNPTYILLNFTGKLHDVLTLAHETGHGINNELMRPKRHALDFGLTMSTAEVASTFTEDFVFEELLKTADDQTLLAILVNKLDGDVATIFRQAALYRFELELHSTHRQKGYLSKDEIGALFIKHMSLYLGPVVKISKGSQNWWVYWSHIRRFFYVYSYVSGLLISKSLQSQVRANPDFITKVKEFLAAGESDSPKNIFAKMDVDITDKSFWERGLKEVENNLNQVETLAKKLKVI